MPDTAQFILNRLTEWGIKRVYGYPGDGIIGLLAAFRRVGDKREFPRVGHEEIGSFAAWVPWGQLVRAGDPRLQASGVFPNFQCARHADVLGLKGIRVDRP